MRGVATIDLGRQARQPTEEDRLVRLSVKASVICARSRSRALRKGESSRAIGSANSANMAIGVDLQQPLDHTPSLQRRHTVIMNEYPAEPIAIHPKVGEGQAGTPG